MNDENLYWRFQICHVTTRCFHQGRYDINVEYEGVTVFGTMRIVEDASASRTVIQLQLDRCASHLRPDRDYDPITSEAVKLTALFCIDIESWSGTRHQKPSDYPGAFTYDAESDL